MVVAEAHKANIFLILHFNKYFLLDNMIQRIQTLFVFIAALITALMLKTDFAEIAYGGDYYVFSAQGITSGENVVFNGLPIMIFIGLIIILHLAIIFLFKRRILQIRLLAFTIILLIGLTGLMFYFLYAGFDEVNVVFKIPMVLPLIAVILDYLAIRSIGKDEALVRSINRIR